MGATTMIPEGATKHKPKGSQFGYLLWFQKKAAPTKNKAKTPKGTSSTSGAKKSNKYVNNAEGKKTGKKQKNKPTIKGAKGSNKGKTSAGKAGAGEDEL